MGIFEDVAKAAGKTVIRGFTGKFKDDVLADQLFNFFQNKGFKKSGLGTAAGRSETDYASATFEKAEKLVKVTVSSRRFATEVSPVGIPIELAGKNDCKITIQVFPKSTGFFKRAVGMGAEKNFNRTVDLDEYIDDALKIIDSSKLNNLFEGFLKELGAF